jgi:hypothetical protein
MDKASGTVLDFFNTVEDPRQRGKVLYRLDEILLIALAGCLAGADNMVEMAGWARMNLESLRSIRPFALALQLHPPFQVGLVGLGLVAAAPDGPGDDESRFDAALDQTPGNTTDLLE